MNAQGRNRKCAVTSAQWQKRSMHSSDSDGHSFRIASGAWLDAGAPHQLTVNHYKRCNEFGSRSSAPGGNRARRTNSSSI
jgi:hypothetical protein